MVRFLVAEKDYLIAMEASEILLSLFRGEVEISTLDNLDEKLKMQRWDVVLVDTDDGGEIDRRRAGRILASGAGLVFLTGHSFLKGGIPSVPEWPVVLKPFTDDQILAATLRAMALAGK